VQVHCVHRVWEAFVAKLYGRGREVWVGGLLFSGSLGPPNFFRSGSFEVRLLTDK
jgi:hypothetical protein